ncbi:MAG: hypothetical protein AAF610_10140 [Pseudomonadota bacterium]
MALRMSAALLAAFLTICVQTSAQTLAVPGAAKASDVSASVPTRGMSMAQVEKSFGSPVARRSAVGDPPITRWEYGEFIVYFEYKHVIHAVAKR